MALMYDNQNASDEVAATGFLGVHSLVKSFGSQPVLRGIDLEVRRGEFITLLGPSGCGKTTLLRIIGGFEAPDAGAVRIAGRDLVGEPPERRPFNTVFQSYALFPHMTVSENVAYGLRATGVAPAEVAQRVRGMLELVHLTPFAARHPRELSGGQQQRVALARALVNDPEVLLLDEPLGALDLQLRRALQDELRAIQRRTGTTFIYVTHDQEEALTLSHRIALMDQGTLAQVGTPQQVYERPVSRFVAEFVGETNMLPATVLEARGERATVRVAADCTLDLHHAGGETLVAGERVLAVLRPEHLSVTGDGAGALSGKARGGSVFMGTHVRHEVVLADGTSVRVNAPAGSALSDGDAVSIAVAAGQGVAVPWADPAATARPSS